VRSYGRRAEATIISLAAPFKPLQTSTSASNARYISLSVKVPESGVNYREKGVVVSLDCTLNLLKVMQ
jgi:hypothetical protein